MSNFVHLHCHTEFSLLDGAIRIKDLAQKASRLGMPATAITDHGNLYGVGYFYTACKDVGVDPIIGCEVYVCNNHMDKVSEFAKIRHHLILLAQNSEGYRNLKHLVSLSYIEGFHYKPRIDKKMLIGHTDGLIALSACIAGEIPRTLVGNNGLISGGGTYTDAVRIANEFNALFPERFYLEVQANGLPEQQRVNERLLQLSEDTKIPLVATNDCHYLDSDDVEAHDILLCIGTQAKVTDKNRYHFEANDLYYKSEEEMRLGLSGIPESAIENTLKIADQCSHVEIQLHAPPYHFPVYPIPEGMTPATELCRIAREGLERRLQKHPHKDSINFSLYRERLEMELKVICDMGFPGYFLIVQDYINWAKDHEIPVGPGRGSAAGSVVAWALRITSLDPLEHRLFFERFLNIERISMPDIDVDFCEDRRLEVLDYVTQKYGADKVTQIAAFGKMKAKAVVKDVGRALGVPYQETTRIAKMIPSDLDITLEKALATSKELAKDYKENSETRKLIDISKKLEGITRHASTHAAGVVVADKPMEEYIALFSGKNGEQVVQFDMKYLEKSGLVKFDFLGLRNMTIISNAVKNIIAQGKEPPDLENLSTDDSNVFDLLSRGDTDGVFQLESSGMRKYLRMLRPSCFEDVVAMLALYRPGPLNSGMVDEFIKRKHGEIKVTYPLPELESCLKDTYGVIVYQEQVMQIAQITAKYTLGGADLLRRAMGKKKPEEMAKQREIFLKGSSERNVDPKKANDIFDLMEKFAEYGFNKAHSAAYAYITYETAYLKYYFKVEYMASLLTAEIGNQDKLLSCIASCNDMGINVCPPDIQFSQRAFVPHNDSIIYGLGGVKNVGDEAINEIIRCRKAEGPFKSLYDLCCRVNLRKVTKRVLENLIKGGALDCFNVSRAALFAVLDKVVTRAQKSQKDKNSGQISLMDLAPKKTVQSLPGIGIICEEQNIPEWEDDTKLSYEKEAIGFYLTSHPLQPYRSDMIRLGLMTIEEISEIITGHEQVSTVSIGVLVTGVKEFTTRKGDKMAFIQVEDLTGHAEVTVFPRTFETIKNILYSDHPIIKLTGTIDLQDDYKGISDTDSGDEDDNSAPPEVKILAESACALQDACKACINPIRFAYPSGLTEQSDLNEFKAILKRYKGASPVIIELDVDGYTCSMLLGEDWSVEVSPQLHKDINEWFSKHNDNTL